MSVAEAPLGHAEVVRGLWRARGRGRLPHALLFEGPAGVGKFRAALWFAQGLFCATWAETGGADDWPGPCGACGPCKRFRTGGHPDAFVLDPLEHELETIPIAAITERDDGKWQGDSVCEFLALRPAEGGMRVVVVREFERANDAAQNALLKTLEEPGESTLLVLESSRPDLLLETVRSRCVTVRFGALDAEDARDVLRAAGSANVRGPLVAWAEGSPGRALLLERQGALAVRAVVADLLHGRLDPLAATRKVLELDGEFPGRTPTAQVRARTRAALDLLLAVLRDGVRLAAGVPAERLPHGDLAALALGRASAWTASLERVVALRGEVELNLSPESLLDRAFLALPRTA